jgi:sterol desaturase/sphingolipid hydroxylase (fatty acid hydroxylase superfamily)
MGMSGIAGATGRTVRVRLQSGDYILLAIPVFFATMGAEYLLLRRRGATGRVDSTDESASNHAEPIGYGSRDTAASLTMGVGSLAFNLIYMKLLTDPVDRWLYRHRLGNVGRARFAFLGALVAWDFLYYWDHRIQHTARLGWANHVTHHSSEYYNLSTALRQPWTGFLMHWIFAPMILAGFTPVQTASAGQLNLLYQYWVHTEAVDRFPVPVEQVMSTASHHRVHHGAQPQYLDRNYGGIFIVWDRLFGTFEPEGERVRYGLTKNIGSFNPLRIAFAEFSRMARDVRATPSWRRRLGQLFGRPRS